MSVINDLNINLIDIIAVKVTSSSLLNSVLDITQPPPHTCCAVKYIRILLMFCFGGIRIYHCKTNGHPASLIELLFKVQAIFFSAP
jgi:hypothetical protein